MYRLLLLVGLLAALIIAGCAENRSLAGEWVADIDIASEESGDNGEDFASDIAQMLTESMEISVTLDPDGTYSETVLFFEVSGRWSQKGDDLVLVPAEINGTKLSDVADEQARGEPWSGEGFFDQ